MEVELQAIKLFLNLNHERSVSAKLGGQLGVRSVRAQGTAGTQRKGYKCNLPPESEAGDLQL